MLKRIDIWLAGELITVLENNAGLTDLGPSLSASLSNSLIDHTEPIVEPKDTPKSSVLSSVIGFFIPASSSASFDAASANLVDLSIFLKPFWPNMASGVKSFTSPASLVLRLAVSKRLTGFIPDIPFIVAFQNSFLPMPLDARTPIPVITIRLRIFLNLPTPRRWQRLHLNKNT